MELELRPAVANDIPAMHRIRTSVTENMLSDANALRHDDYLPYLGNSGETWIGEFDSRIAGFGTIDQDNGSIWALFVAPDFESRGVGKALLAQVTRRARALGISTLKLTTTPDTRAEQFYIRRGWKVTGTAPNGELVLQIALTENFAP